jgi:hypothetical protein
MKSLKHLVEKDGVTIVSVIHQPRKFIYDLFDSLILLGVGGKMVYHGPTTEANPYFNRLNYSLPEGESVADWLIDISSGRLEPDNQVATCRKSEKAQLYRQTKTSATASRNLDVDVNDEAVGDSSLGTMPTGDSIDDPDTTAAQNVGVSGVGRIEQNGKVAITGSPLVVENAAAETAAESEKVDGATTEAPSGFYSTVKKTFKKEISLDILDLDNIEPQRSYSADSADELLSPGKLQSTTHLDAAGRCVTDEDCVGTKGVTTGKVVQAFVEAKVRRAWLYRDWNKYFDRLSDAKRHIYRVPSPYQLPSGIEKPSFLYQLNHQLGRALIVAWRNRFNKFIDSIIIIGAVIIITALDGVAQVTLENEPDIPFEIMVRPNEDDVVTIFTELFGYSLTRQIQ